MHYQHPEDFADNFDYQQYFEEEDSENQPSNEDNYIYHHYNNEPSTENTETFYCEACDRDFFPQFKYLEHMSQHKTCNIDGCKFTAHEKIIAVHVRMQHSSGLYDKIRNIESPEDIAAWIEQRKKRFPSKENIVKRQLQQEELLKKGLRIRKNDNKFGKDKYRCEYIH